MGGSSNSKRGRKKGRPSQLDLHKRSLRLQKTSSSAAAASDSDDSGPRQREKKLKHVLRLSADESDESEGGARKRLRIAGDIDKNSRGSEDGEGSGASTPLPDRKLLVLVLDRLQKKDTYGVYSEPVDPEELPDYHDIIKHPMDFRTVREKLADGAYANLEQFEQDVFLISSNAMQYNSADTIYYRQARSIHELAKKDFESLRQESDDNEPEPEPEPKVVRRGRPPNKNTIKRPVGRPPAERTGSDFSSDAHFANARDNGHWSGMVHDSSLHSTAGVSTRASHGISYAERRNWASESKSERIDEYSGSTGRGNKMKYGKNPSVIDDNRRNTYIHSQSSSTYVQDPLVSTSFNGERKLLVPVGLQIEQAYARSLAMFAAELGPVAWEIAAKRIERVLPPGTKFGSGWVGDSEAPQQSQKLVISTPPPHPSSQPNVPPFTGIARDDPHSVKRESSEGKTTLEAPLRGAFSSSAATNRPSEPVRSAHLPGGFKVEASSSGIRSNPHLQLQQKLQNPGIQHPVNGFNTAHGFNLLSQVEKMSRQASPLGNFGNEAVMMTHARALDMVSRGNNSFNPQRPMSQLDAGSVKSDGNASVVHSASPLPEMDREAAQGQWRGASLNPKPAPDPPDLNVGFQSPGPSVSGTPVESQQPDLALQL